MSFFDTVGQLFNGRNTRSAPPSDPVFSNMLATMPTVTPEKFRRAPPVVFEQPTMMGRSIAAVLPGLGTSDIIKMQSCVDDVLTSKLTAMRNTSRGLSMNSGQVRAFLSMVENHVIGSKGVTMKNRARKANGEFDKVANDTINAAYIKWGTANNSDVRKSLSFREQQKLVMRTTARDGECFIRKVKKFPGSVHKFALQMIPAELVDERYNDDRKNIRCGIEFDIWGAPVAYYVRQDRASILRVNGITSHEYLRIPADEMIHVFVREFPDQSRGIPWVCSVVIKLHQLNQYEEAEVMAARIGASKMGFLHTPDGDGKALANGKTDTGALSSTVAPGVIDVLPAGYQFTAFDPQHPGGNFPAFTKAMNRNISAALRVSYNLLCNDLEGVNYSSIRAGVMEDREGWRSLHQMFNEQFLDNVFPDWMEHAYLSGALPGVIGSKLELYIAPKWGNRGWAWIDPLKDADAAITAINAGLKSRQSVLAEQGVDLEDVCEENAEDLEMLASYGLTHLAAAPSTSGKPEQYDENKDKELEKGKKNAGKDGKNGEEEEQEEDEEAST